MIFSIIIFDTFSYICGSLFGKKKIIPSISPNKTYFGAMSGYLISIILSYLVFNFLLYPTLTFPKLNFLLITSLVLLFAFLGDLLESYFKRISKIKNSSSFFPGHGGFFDRMDSYILSIFLLPLINIIL